MTTVNKDNVRKWVDALRDGGYRQATGNLTNGDGFCCLGVACDISGVGSWNEMDEYETEYDSGDGPVQEFEASALPRAVQEWLGVDTDNPELPHTPEQGRMTCIGANDDFGLSFEQIADLIEAQYLAEPAEPALIGI